MSNFRPLEFADWTVYYYDPLGCGVRGYHEFEGMVVGYKLEVIEKPLKSEYRAHDENDLKSAERVFVACLAFREGCVEEWGEPRGTLEEAKRDVVEFALVYCKRAVESLQGLGSTPRESGERYRHSDHRSYWKPLPVVKRGRVCWRSRNSDNEGKGPFVPMEEAKAEIAAEEDADSPYIYWIEEATA